MMILLLSIAALTISACAQIELEENGNYVGFVDATMSDGIKSLPEYIREAGYYTSYTNPANLLKETAANIEYILKCRSYDLV